MSTPNSSDAAEAARIISELRAKMLSLRLEDIGLKSTTYSHEVYGLLMETGFDDGDSYSLVVVADGATSIYFSNGGGIIGAGEHANVRKASENMLAQAERFRVNATPTRATPLPKPGKVVFYFVTKAGILTYTALEEALGEGRDKLSPLFEAGHRVITEVRKIEERGHRESAK